MHSAASMSGTVILTGANGSLALSTTEQLLDKHGDFTLILAVRDAAQTDPNTQKLRTIIARYPKAKATIHQVDHASLTSVHDFATKISTAISAGEMPPIASIICNASYWNLVADSKLTVDGHDKTIQVNHIAHAALVLRLIGSFADQGRIVLLSSVGHYRKPNTMTSIIPDIPEDMDRLNHLPPDNDKQGRGFNRYAISKLLITTWMYPLNDYLQKSPEFKSITAVTINPGGLGDSRAFSTNTPRSIQLMQKLILKPLMPVINRLADSTFRSSAAAGVDVAELAVCAAHAGERGYFTMLNKDESDPVTMDTSTQKRVWQTTLTWAGITRDNTALKGAFDSS
jgi:NAD(P)-dependent dehydrogenase (short-subunit alcohol dehydrogenase family)